MSIDWFLIVSALVFCIGAGGVLTRRNPLVVLFCLYLVAMILAVVPASLLLQRLLRPLLARRLESQKTYFEAPSGP